MACDTHSSLMVLTDGDTGRYRIRLDRHRPRVGTVLDGGLRRGNGEYAVVRQLAGDRFGVATFRQSVFLTELTVSAAAVVRRRLVLVVLRFDDQFVAHRGHLKVIHRLNFISVGESQL